VRNNIEENDKLPRLVLLEPLGITIFKVNIEVDMQVHIPVILDILFYHGGSKNLEKLNQFNENPKTILKMNDFFC
jgi:hypothetical protein